MKVLLFSLALAVLAFWAPHSAVDPVARMIVPAIALMATGIFPCMTLAVGAMKGEHRTPSLVDDLYEQLRKLMQVLVLTFGLAVLSVVLLASTIALKEGQAPGWAVSICVSAAVLTIGMLGGRVAALGRAFFVVLDINRKHALLIARAKLKGERDAAFSASKLAKFAPDDDKPRTLNRA